MQELKPKCKHKYFLLSLYLEDEAQIPLTEACYTELLHARQALIDAGFFEERYELLTENYKAFEVFCATQSLDARIGGDYRIEPASKTISEANRLLMNFLTSVCSYTDQVKGEFKTTTSGARFRSEANSRLQALRGNSKDFALLEVARNYVQHVGMLVQGIESNRSRESNWAESATPYALGETLAEYADRNRRRPIDIKPTIPEKVDLRALCYTGLRILSEFHCSLRNVANEDCATARTLIKGAIDQVNSHLEQSGDLKQKARPARLQKITTNAQNDDEYVDHTLLLDWDDVRKARAAKNRKPIDDFKNGTS